MCSWFGEAVVDAVVAVVVGAVAAVMVPVRVKGDP